MAEQHKRRWGDRKDGRLLRELDPMHYITPLIYPHRCDNEAYISERIDLGPVNDYLKKLNENETEFPYTMFHLIVAALVKTLTLRPKMNRFIANRNVYQRNEVSASFVVKKKFSDNGEEGLAFLHTRDEDTLQTLHEALRKQVFAVRSNKNDSTADSMDILTKMPRFLSRFLLDITRFLDKHGWAPNFLIASDPYYSSIVFSNVGSIKLKCGYHHLTNWGTNSVFCLIGEKKKTPVFDQQTGEYTMRETVDLGITIDERLADGYYYSKSIKLFKHLLAHPELLEQPMINEVDYNV